MPWPLQSHDAPAVGAEPKPAARDADAHDVGIARVDEHRVDAGIVGAAADPELAVRDGSKALSTSCQLVAAVASSGTAPPGIVPHQSSPVALRSLERPDALHSPTASACGASDRRRRVLGLRRVLRHRALLPASRRRRASASSSRRSGPCLARRASVPSALAEHHVTGSPSSSARSMRQSRAAASEQEQRLYACRRAIVRAMISLRKVPEKHRLRCGH